MKSSIHRDGKENLYKLEPVWWPFWEWLGVYLLYCDFNRRIFVFQKVYFVNWSNKDVYEY